MDDTADISVDAIERIRARDFTLKYVMICERGHEDTYIQELVDCLLEYNPPITHLSLDRNSLTDVTGVKVAQFVARTRTLLWLDLSCNLLSEKTMLAVATALRVNTSLKYLHLERNARMDDEYVRCAFVDALRINPVCGLINVRLRGFANECQQLRDEAARDHPTLQLLLACRDR